MPEPTTPSGPDPSRPGTTATGSTPAETAPPEGASDAEVRDPHGSGHEPGSDSSREIDVTDRSTTGSGTGPRDEGDTATAEHGRDPDTADRDTAGRETAGPQTAAVPPPREERVTASSIYPPTGRAGALPKHLDWEGPTLVWERPRSTAAIIGTFLLLAVVPPLALFAILAFGPGGEAGAALVDTSPAQWSDETWVLIGVIALLLVFGLALSSLVVGRMGHLVRIDSEGLRSVSKTGKVDWSQPWGAVDQVTVVDEVRKEGRSSARTRMIELAPSGDRTKAVRMEDDAWSLDDMANIVATWYGQGWVPADVTYTERLPAFRDEVAQAARKAEQEGRKSRG